MIHHHHQYAHALVELILCLTCIKLVYLHDPLDIYSYLSTSFSSLGKGNVYFEQRQDTLIIVTKWKEFQRTALFMALTEEQNCPIVHDTIM